MAGSAATLCQLVPSPTPPLSWRKGVEMQAATCCCVSGESGDEWKDIAGRPQEEGFWEYQGEHTRPQLQVHLLWSQLCVLV